MELHHPKIENANAFMKDVDFRVQMIWVQVRVLAINRNSFVLSSSIGFVDYCSHVALLQLTFTLKMLP